MRLASRNWLVLLAGLGSFSCVGGPTSDWPFNRSPGGDSSDREEGGSDDDSDAVDEGDDDREPAEPTAPGMGRRDAGSSRPASRADGGTVAFDGSTGAPGMGGDAGAPADESDAGESDASMGAQCTPESDRREYGGCFGMLCNMSRDALSSEAEPSRACTGDQELALACDGEIARVVASCAEREVTAIGMGRAILSCARRAPTLGDADASCVSCYVEEVVCSMRNCLVACLDGSSTACAECRMASCGERFATCSGLPRTSGNGAISPAHVDAGLGDSKRD